jgi:Zn-dependent protease with chaperone function
MNQLRSFPGLSAKAYQHPLDVAAIRTLAATPGLQMLAKAVSTTFFERINNIEYTGHCVRVGTSQYPDIYRRYVALAQRLDVRRIPDLYVKSAQELNAYSQGVDRYYIVVHTGLLEVLEDAEIDAILAHELGHVKCDHMKYLTIVTFLRAFGPLLQNLISIPLVTPAVMLGAQIALVQWFQKSELSADRAALLATQDVGIVQSALSKLAGFSRRHCEHLNIEALEQQASDFDDIGAESLFEKALKAWTLLGLTHPMPVVRIREAGLWAQSAQYAKLLNGEYLSEERIPIAGPYRECSKCHSRQAPDAFFCGECGTNIRLVPVSSPVVQPSS